MAGGIGSRFWPASRTAIPKQFVDVLGIGKSLLQLTFQRFLGLVKETELFVVTGPAYVELIGEQLPNLPQENILVEPNRKNTAPALAFACIKIQAQFPDANVIVAPADHLILKEESFITLIKEGINFVSQNLSLLTLGIQPTTAHTGYGYIKYNTPEGNNNNAIKGVASFVEKPDAITAASYLEAGNYLWNAGIFLWNVNTFLAALEEHAVEVYDAFVPYKASVGLRDETEALDKAFEKVNDLSIDYAIMEKADNVFTLPADIGWSDLGAWNALHEVSPKRENNNVLVGCSQVALDETNQCLIKAPAGKLVVIKGLTDYLVIDENDVLMIYPRSEEQSIKQVRKYLEDNSFADFL